MHSVGVSGALVGWALLSTLVAMLVLAAVTGARQQGGPWWTTLVYTAAFAVLAGWVLISLIGPDSGMPGACSPGETCDLDQGMGYVSAPMLFAPLLLATMAASRGVTAAVRRMYG